MSVSFIYIYIYIDSWDSPTIVFTGKFLCI